MKYYQFLSVFILSVISVQSKALEMNTSPFLTSTADFKYYTANVLFDSRNKNLMYGPTLGFGIDSDISLTFIGGRAEYTRFKHFYGTCGYSIGFLNDTDASRVTYFPFMYSIVGTKYQYKKVVFKAGIGMMSSKVFSRLQDKSILSDSNNEKTMVPTAEIKVGFRF